MGKLEKVINLCKKSYPTHNYEGHLVPVVDLTLQLCEEFGADRNIVEPAAYLHDIGRVKFGFLELFGIDHALSGYYYSRFKLSQLGYSKEEVEKISYAVLAHRGDKIYIPKSLEDTVVANGDTLSHFKEYQYLLAIQYSSNGKKLAKARDWVLWKLKHSYDTKLTLPGLKEGIEPMYERAKKELTANNKLISFIVIGCDHAKELDKCLSSIKTQTYSPIEIVYVDSSDDEDRSIEVAKRYTQEIYSVEKRGANFSRNNGAEKANGDVLIFINGNDELEKTVAAEVNQSVQCGTEVGSFRWGTKSFYLKDWIVNTILNVCHYKAWPAFFISKHLFKRSGGFKQTTTKDINDISKIALRLRKSFPSKRLKSRIYGNMGQFHKHGYLNKLMQWLELDF